MLLRTIIIINLLLATPAIATHNYVVRIDSDLKRMHVTAIFAAPQNEIAARSRNAGDFLLTASDCDAHQPLQNDGRRLRIPAAGIRCLSYEVDMRRAAAAERRNATLADNNLLLAPAVWFWRPALEEAAPVQVRFELGEGIELMLPWKLLDPQLDLYQPMRSPQSSTSVAAIGRFDSREESIPGATLRIALLAGQQPYAGDGIAAWIADTAATINLAYGRFPNPAPTVIVIPVGDSARRKDAVTFGRVIRDGGESIELFINEASPLEDFAGNWTATHEFTHLMLPYVERKHRWISEGFAQYYQNVLLARSGHYSEQQAWEKILDGLERGRQSVPALSPNAAALADTSAARMKVYWSGAALALMADLELRRRSAGRESLDTVLDRLQACCLPSAHSWSGPELLHKMDTLISEPVFMPIYRQFADTDGFPDVRPQLRQLGVSRNSDTVRLSQLAPLAAVRSAITAPRLPVASDHSGD